MSDIAVEPRVTVARTPFWRSRTAILLAGVFVIPSLLALALNSYGALTVDSAIRMAFTTVAGQTIAILSGLGALVMTVVRRAPWPGILFFSALAVIISVWAVVGMVEAAALLQSRLDLVAETDLLNG